MEFDSYNAQNLDCCIVRKLCDVRLIAEAADKVCSLVLARGRAHDNLANPAWRHAKVSGNSRLLFTAPMPGHYFCVALREAGFCG